MSYQITFKGRSDENSIIVDNIRGEKIKALVFDGKKDTPIDIDGDLYLIGSIKQINSVPDPKPIAYTPVPLIASATRSKCKGQYSIQLEVNRIAKDEGGKQWAKLITDKKWREETRQKLRTTGAYWCDYKANECACDPDKPGQGIEAIHSIFYGDKSAA